MVKKQLHMNVQSIANESSLLEDILNPLPGLAIVRHYGYRKEFTSGIKKYVLKLFNGENPQLQCFEKINASTLQLLSIVSLIVKEDGKFDYRHDVDPKMTTSLLIHKVLEFWRDLNAVLVHTGRHIPHPGLPKTPKGYTGY